MMARAKNVELRSSEDVGAAKTYEEAAPRADTPPKRERSVEAASESAADEEATRKEAMLIETFDSSRAPRGRGEGVAGSRRATPNASIDERAPGAGLRLKGNEAMKCGDFALAQALYGEALDAAREEDAHLRAVVFCNRALAFHKMNEYDAALCDAKCAEELAPTWSKPKHRLAEACLRLGSYTLAVTYARLGEKLQFEEGDFSKSFRDVLDEIAICAAEDGSVAGFDGKLIYVRSAGEDAWLGREAPLNAAFDELEGEVADPMFGGGSAKDANSMKPVHARSLPEAISKANDGDRILLLRGVHNGLGTVVEIDKRVLIRGEGALRDTTCDCRNNAALFRIKRPCVIQNLDIDFTGFSEAIRIKGDSRVNALIENCVIRSSGGDCVAVGGKSAPTFRNCSITGKLSGVRSYAQATPTFIDCNITRSGLQGVLAMKESRVIMHGCAVQNNEEDGVVVMEQSNVVMSKCVVQDNKGPGVDVSNTAKVVVNDCDIDANVGGLWLWDHSCAHVAASSVNGGKSHAVLVDVNARANCRRTKIIGVVHASETGARGVRGEGTVVETLETPTSLPQEAKGAFKHDPCGFSRKQ
jgi:tetratricopeptide (TPR) repeat protein|tara:strand:+ start:120 stop:1877 length:1758 start_codon:yes stop_codon:yes gene_type:complete